MSKSLQTLQTLSKIGKILCKIIFILSIIGAVGCVIGIVSLASIPGDLMFDGQSIRDIIMADSGMSIGTLYAVMAVALIMCVSECVVCKFAEKYFKNELKAGTPFTFDGAKEMFRLGIIVICVSIGSAVLASITYAIISAVLGDVKALDFNGILSIMPGIVFLILSVIFKNGAEQASKQEKQEELPQETSDYNDYNGNSNNYEVRE